MSTSARADTPHVSVTTEPLREPTSGAANSLRPASGGIVVFSASLWVVCAALILLFHGPQHWGAQAAWPSWVALPVLAAGFACAEIFVIHLRIRADSHTFSLVELPLAFGLFYAQPLAMIFAQLVAAVLVLVLHRKQSPLKVAFNTAVFIVTTLAAVIVFRAVAGELTDDLQGTTLLQGGAALLMEAMLSVVLVSSVIRIASGSWRSAELVSNAAFGLATATFTTSLGIVAVVVVDAHPEIAWLLVLPVAGTYLASWAYSSQRRRHEGLDFLYQSTKLLHQSAEFETAFGELLRRTCDTFNAAASEVVYLPGSEAEPICFQLGSGAIAHTHELEARHHVLMGLLGDRQPLIMNENPDGLGTEFLRLSGYSAAIVAPLLGDTRVVGALVIANPLSSVIGFDATDARLAGTLANQTAAALENGRLEQSLEQLRVLEGRLSFEATHDPLTGLANRELFRVSLAKVIDEATGCGAVLFIDLDDFKTVNDSCGHAAGDALLIEVATRLRNSVSVNDTVARLGGDEFAILLNDVADVAQAAAAAQRILQSFEPAALVTSRRMYIRASIGAAMVVPGADPVAMMRDADTAMYVAKAQGKNRVIGFESSMHESSLHRFSLHADLIQGIDNGEMVTYYQPIVDLDSGVMLGAEALVRWNHPELGILAPASFLPIAEISGLITTIDRIVMEQACDWLARSEAIEPGLVPWVNVNVSPVSFRDPELVQRITSVLQRHRLDPRRLGIEITENLILDQEGATHATLQELKHLGVRLALDDFGTGYSSLSYLRDLPVDVIKIAKPFIDDIDQVDPPRSALAFTSAIVALVTALDRFIVAEGIERPEQASILRSLGCHAGQGYHFRRPMTGEVFVGWALRRRDAVEFVHSIGPSDTKTTSVQQPSPVG